MPAQPASAPLALLGRLAWMLVGPLGLTFVTLHIMARSTGWLTPADAVYAALLGLMLLGRWLEFRGGHPETATGEPATAADLHRYVYLVVGGGLTLWVLANLIGNHVLA